MHRWCELRKGAVPVHIGIADSTGSAGPPGFVDGQCGAVDVFRVRTGEKGNQSRHVAEQWMMV